MVHRVPLVTADVELRPNEAVVVEAAR